MPDRLYIFDTTLRDGEQTPGAATFTKEEKLLVAKELVKLKVDIIEVGFPISSKEEAEVVELVAKNVKGVKICALARTKKEDIDAAYEAIKYAELKRIHTFISSSDIHIKYQLRKTREEVINIVKDMVGYAKNYVDDVEFSPMDATRTTPEFLYKIIETAIDAGATVINIPDTVGYITPKEFGNLILSIKERIKDKAIISIHCHNDLGLAVANTLEGVLAGARQVEVTINGIGERAGNAALEEVVMAINTRRNVFNVECNINTKELYSISRLISSLTGIPVQPNKAIVGKNAFLHASGIHQDGVLKSPLTYEIIRPETVGVTTPQKISIGKLSGKHALRVKLKELGYDDIEEDKLQEILTALKELSAKKKKIYDEDIIVLVDDMTSKEKEDIYLQNLQVQTGLNIIPTAVVSLKIDNKIKQETASGDGPVDAIYNAIMKIIKKEGMKLVDYSLQAVTEGSKALGKVTVKIEYKDKISTGHGTDTDIIVASAKALLHAINKQLSHKPKTHTPSS